MSVEPLSERDVYSGREPSEENDWEEEFVDVRLTKGGPYVYCYTEERLKEIFSEIKRIRDDQPLMGCGEMYNYLETYFGPLVPK